LRTETLQSVQAQVCFRMYRSFPRRVFLELREFRIHRVPWLRVGRPNFVLRFVQTRIIQSPSRDALSEIGLPPNNREPHSGQKPRTLSPIISLVVPKYFGVPFVILNAFAGT